MSSDLERLRNLLAKTEKNIKIIEAVNGNFALAVLNEWRYSTWHVLSACLDEQGGAFADSETAGATGRVEV